MSDVHRRNPYCIATDIRLSLWFSVGNSDRIDGSPALRSLYVNDQTTGVRCSMSMCLTGLDGDSNVLVSQRYLESGIVACSRSPQKMMKYCPIDKMKPTQKMRGI